MTPVVGGRLWLWFGGNLTVGITQAIVTAKAFDQRVIDQVMCGAMKLCRVIVKVCLGHFYKLAIGDAIGSAVLPVVTMVVLVKPISDTSYVAKANPAKKTFIVGAILGQLVPSQKAGVRWHRGKSSRQHQNCHQISHVLRPY